MDNLLQQLENHSAVRTSPQGPADLKHHQGDDHSSKPSVVLNGSPKLLDRFNSEELLKTIESVGGIKSYKFLSSERAQPVNYVKDSIGGTLVTTNVSSDVYDIANVQDTVENNEENADVNKLKCDNLENTSEVTVLYQQAKLQKQDAVDVESDATNEHSGHFSDYSENSLNPVSGTCDLQNNYKEKETSNLGIMELPEKGEREVLAGNPEDTKQSDLLEDGKDEDDDQSVKNLISLGGDEVQDYKIPDEIPVVSGWKLDRRASGHLFWRRDSSTLNGVDPRSRVKFRYDVEVCEFESRGSETEDLLEEDDEDDDKVALDSEEVVQRKSYEESSNPVDVTADETPSSTLMVLIYFVAAFGVIASLLYSWLNYLLFKESVDETQND